MRRPRSSLSSFTTNFLSAICTVIAAGTGIAAILSEMTALQRAKATTVVPVSFAVQTFLPIILEPLFLRERWATADYYGIPLVLGMVLLFIGMLTVSRTRAVTQLVAAGEGGT